QPDDGYRIRELEDQVDKYEDELGTYLVKINSRELDEKSSRDVTKLLHLLSDFERISDHSVDIIRTAEEMKEKNLDFSDRAKKELDVLFAALSEILMNTKYAFEHNDTSIAQLIEPLEQTIDTLVLKIKDNHVSRLRSNECTIEHGFILSDLLTSCSRISDHCSNIAGLIIEICQYDAMNMHEYLNHVKKNGEEFKKNFDMYMQKYTIAEQ
ncbi:MAG: Na/Pi cotransporter family protein, partial [Clostridia bacterium]|nr:Na/Pi cotransporter family protein [Clostridia bacterium]